jgi:glycerol kinase
VRAVRRAGGRAPPLRADQRDFGTLDLGAARVPFRVLTGDQSAALFALGPARADTAYGNFGTGAFLQRAVESPPRRLPRLLASVVWSDGIAARRVVEARSTARGAPCAGSRPSSRSATSSRTWRSGSRARSIRRSS